MKIVGVIPCRYGSKRFEGKPVRPILGKPMIQWVYERAQRADLFDDVVIATDDDRIRSVVEGFGAKVVMTAARHPSGSDRVAEAAKILGLERDDIVINIQGDQPAFDTRCLSEVISPLFEDPDLGMTTLIFKIINEQEFYDSNHVKCVFDCNGYALYFSRALIPFSGAAPVTFDVFKHLGIYAYRKHFLDYFTSLPQTRLEVLERLEQNRVLEHGSRIKVVVTTHDSLEVDTPNDIKKLESVLANPESGEKTRR
ncbi:MAG: 3-deoxy-manno-octulosonate cytidylyltransferase [Deltaproteobacteria bacterium]|nr:3-deoxy-manno-octulosonate cytidylyltransferase [Deltaproteobacteria bacterium]